MDQTIQNIENKCNRVVVFFYCLLIWFLPISIALIETCVGFAITAFIVKRVWLILYQLRQMSASGRPADLKTKLKLFAGIFKLPDSPLNKPMAVFALFVVISVLHSHFFMTSLVGFFGKFVEDYMIYLSFADCFRTKPHIRNFMAIYCGSGFLMGINGLTQYFIGTEFIHGHPIEYNRVASSMRHANDFGGWLVMIIPLALSLLLMPWGRQPFLKEWKDGFGSGVWYKILVFVIFILVVACMGLTYSRGGWLAFIFAMLALAFFRKKGFLWAVGVAVIFFMVFSPGLVKARNVTFLSDDMRRGAIDKDIVKSQKSLLQRTIDAGTPHEFSGMGRAGFWGEAITLIKKNPLFGNGYNTYARLAKATGYYAHNCYLQMAAEIGIPGLISFLVLMGFVFFGPLRDLSKMQDPFLHAVQAGALAGLSGFLAQSFLDTSFYSVQLSNLMWIFIGMIVALHRMPGRSQ